MLTVVGAILIIEPGDLAGSYDYIPDIESMGAPSGQDMEAKLMTLLQTMTNPAIVAGLAQEGKRPKYSELIAKAMEATNVIKDADAYFEDIQNAQMMGGVTNDPNQINGGGGNPQAGGPQAQGAMPNAGMDQGSVPAIGGANQNVSSGPAQV
jgi:hypothetical protein